ncbi:MAG: hypothetical protein GX307_05080 [Euryarchaeota archaeon]|nr:hypothetical protein [Euryarchaeota archaeon]
MAKSNDDLVREINELRTEMKQMKDLLNVLFSLVIETDEGDEEEYAFPVFSQELPKFNN